LPIVRIAADAIVGQYEHVEIRRLDAASAAGAAELFRTVQRSVLTTATYLLHRESAMPARTRRLTLVAVEGAAVVGYGSAYLKWEGGSTDEARAWVAVLPRHRRRGLGTELAERVERHAIEVGAKRLGTIVENDPEGAAFATARGYQATDADIVSSIVPHHREVPQRDGFSVVSLRELAGRERDLYGLWAEAGAFVPAGNAPTFEEWRQGMFENPLLERSGSFTILDDERRPVSLSWLLVDAERGRAENEWTATVPRLRSQGLARLAKLHTINWAAEHGIREIVTASDQDNIAMLELNRSLGYRRLWRRQSFARDV
jgi:GNAT superfamily N-acetyltransferase